MYGIYLGALLLGIFVLPALAVCPRLAFDSRLAYAIPGEFPGKPRPNGRMRAESAREVGEMPRRTLHQTHDLNRAVGGDGQTPLARPVPEPVIEVGTTPPPPRSAAHSACAHPRGQNEAHLAFRRRSPSQRTSPGSRNARPSPRSPPSHTRGSPGGPGSNPAARRRSGSPRLRVAPRGWPFKWPSLAERSPTGRRRWIRPPCPSSRTAATGRLEIPVALRAGSHTTNISEKNPPESGRSQRTPRRPVRRQFGPSAGRLRAPTGCGESSPPPAAQSPGV